MILKNFIFPLLVVLMLTVGQIGFKLVAAKMQDGYSLQAFWNAKFELAGVLFLYGVATLLWIYVLSYMPLSQAFSFYAVVFVIVPILSFALFGEDVFNWRYIIGTCLIITGVLLTVRL